MFFRVKEKAAIANRSLLFETSFRNIAHIQIRPKTHDAPPHRRRKPPVCSRRNGNRIVGIPPTSPKTTLNRDHTQNHPHPPPDPSARPFPSCSSSKIRFPSVQYICTRQKSTLRTALVRACWMIPLISERKSTFNDLSNSIFISYDISHKSNKLFVNPKITLRYHSFLF